MKRSMFATRDNGIKQKKNNKRSQKEKNGQSL